MAPPPLPVRPLQPKTRFLVLDLNGVLVQCVHCPRVPTVPYCKPEDANYDGPPTYIKSKLCPPAAGSSALPTDHPTKMVGGRVELHDGR